MAKIIACIPNFSVSKEVDPVVFQQLVDVVVERAMFAGIAGREDAGAAAEGFDLEAGVVGETAGASAFVDPLGFLQGVAFEGVGRFGNIAVQTHFVEAFDGDGVSQYFSDF